MMLNQLGVIYIAYIPVVNLGNISVGFLNTCSLFHLIPLKFEGFLIPPGPAPLGKLLGTGCCPKSGACDCICPKVFTGHLLYWTGAGHVIVTGICRAWIGKCIAEIVGVAGVAGVKCGVGGRVPCMTCDATGA